MAEISIKNMQTEKELMMKDRFFNKPTKDNNSKQKNNIKPLEENRYSPKKLENFQTDVKNEMKNYKRDQKENEKMKRVIKEQTDTLAKNQEYLNKILSEKKTNRRSKPMNSKGKLEVLETLVNPINNSLNDLKKMFANFLTSSENVKTEIQNTHATELVNEQKMFFDHCNDNLQNLIFKTIQGLNALKMENIPIQSDIEGLDKVGYTNTIEALKVQVEDLQSKSNNITEEISNECVKRQAELLTKRIDLENLIEKDLNRINYKAIKEGIYEKLGGEFDYESYVSSIEEVKSDYNNIWENYLTATLDYKVNVPKYEITKKELEGFEFKYSSVLDEMKKKLGIENLPTEKPTHTKQNKGKKPSAVEENVFKTKGVRSGFKNTHEKPTELKTLPSKPKAQPSLVIGGRKHKPAPPFKTIFNREEAKTKNRPPGMRDPEEFTQTFFDQREWRGVENPFNPDDLDAYKKKPDNLIPTPTNHNTNPMQENDTVRKDNPLTDNRDYIDQGVSALKIESNLNPSYPNHNPHPGEAIDRSQQWDKMTLDKSKFVETSQPDFTRNANPYEISQSSVQRKDFMMGEALNAMKGEIQNYHMPGRPAPMQDQNDMVQGFTQGFLSVLNTALTGINTAMESKFKSGQGNNTGNQKNNQREILIENNDEVYSYANDSDSSLLELPPLAFDPFKIQNNGLNSVNSGLPRNFNLVDYIQKTDSDEESLPEDISGYSNMGESKINNKSMGQSLFKSEGEVSINKAKDSNLLSKGTFGMKKPIINTSNILHEAFNEEFQSEGEINF